MRIEIERVREWISWNVEKLTEPEDVAIHLHVSLHQLRTEFSWSCGTPLSHYIRSEKISKAAELIRTSDLRWFEIVARLRLGRPDNASRLFKRQLGTTVREYKRAHGNYHA
jgi:two-component system response regulator YesN